MCTYARAYISVAADVSSQEMQAAWHTFGAAFAFTLPLVLVLMVAPLIPVAKAVLATNLLPWSEIHGRSSVLTIAGFLGVALASPVQFGAGGVFYKRAWAALRRGGTNMEVLIALGTSVAYFYSLGSLIAGIAGVPLSTSSTTDSSSSSSSGSSGDHGHDLGKVPMEGGGAMFFETSAMLITFVSLGKALEAYSKGQTGSAVRSLLALQEPEATLLEQVDINSNNADSRHAKSKRRSSLSSSSPSTSSGGHNGNSNGGGSYGGAARARRSSWSGGGGMHEGEGTDPATLADASLFKEISVDCRLLQRGDLVLVLGGARLPCDGVLVRTLSGAANGGVAAVDEAMLTGEAMPVNKRIGDNLLGGTVMTIAS